MAFLAAWSASKQTSIVGKLAPDDDTCSLGLSVCVGVFCLLLYNVCCHCRSYAVAVSRMQEEYSRQGSGRCVERCCAASPACLPACACLCLPVPAFCLCRTVSFFFYGGDLPFSDWPRGQTDRQETDRPKVQYEILNPRETSRRLNTPLARVLSEPEP